MNIFQHCFNAAIRALQTLRDQDISDREIAQTYDTSPVNLSRWRNGQTTNEGADTLLKLLCDLPIKKVQEILASLRKTPPQPNNLTSIGDVIQIGEENFALEDLFLGTCVLGGIGSGKTSAALRPILVQLLALCNGTEGEFNKIGGLIIDPKGEILPTLVTTFQSIGRPLSDIILLNPEASSHTYNPINPQESAETISERFKQVLRLSSGGGGDNSYWEETSKKQIGYALQVLGITKEEVTVSDLLEFFKSNAKAEEICDLAEKILKEKESDNLKVITQLTAIEAIKNEWLALNPKTQMILRAGFSNMFGGIAINPTLQKTFCNGKTFSFQDVIRGKILVFHNPNGDTTTNRLIGLCLKADFHKVAMERTNGGCSQTQRPLLLLCDEFQEILSATLDCTPLGQAPGAKIIHLLASQSITSLEYRTLSEAAKTFRHKIGNWVFFHNTDKATADFATLLLPSSPKVYDLKVVTPKKGSNGIWYSEAIIYRPNKAAEGQTNPFPQHLSVPEIIESPQTAELFLAAIASEAVSKGPHPKKPDPKKLLPVEIEIIRILELTRQKIVSQFAGISENPLEATETGAQTDQANIPPYRMLDGLRKNKEANEAYFSAAQTLHWAISAFSYPLYNHFRETFSREENLLPNDLKTFLGNAKNEEIFKILKNLQNQ